MEMHERRLELLYVQQSALKNALQDVLDETVYRDLEEQLRKTGLEIELLEEPLKVATVRGYRITGPEVEAYMPANYRVLCHDEDADGDLVLIAGSDVAGWTMDDYIIPRLASGNKYATETREHLRALVERLGVMSQGCDWTPELGDQLAQLQAVLSRADADARTGAPTT